MKSTANSNKPVRNWLPLAAVVVVGVLMPFLVSSGFQIRLATLICIYAVLSMGFNLLYGYCGQITMGQQGFFAIGAYGYTLLQSQAGLPFWAAIPASLVVCAVLALLVGAPLLRLRTHYLAMATLTLSLVLAGVANRWIDFTGGTAGLSIPSISVGDAFLTRTQLYYAILVVMVVVLLIQNFIVNGHLGRALRAIRDDERAAVAMGVNATVVKLRVFMLAAVFAGIAGIAFGLANRQVSPSMAEFPILVNILTIAVVGGLGTRYGPLLGSVVVVLAPQFLAQFGEMETLVYGACLLMFLLFKPEGLASLGRDVGRWRLSRQQGAKAGGAAAPQIRTEA